MEVLMEELFWKEEVDIVMVEKEVRVKVGKEVFDEYEEKNILVMRLIEKEVMR